MDKLITEITRTECFIGVEAEGPNRGSSVLFVPGSVTVERISKVLRKYLLPGVTRIYYGAGNDRNISLPVLYRILSYADLCSYGVDVEIDSLYNAGIVRKLLKEYNLDWSTIFFHLYHNDSNCVTSSKYKMNNNFEKYVFNGVIVWQSTTTGNIYCTSMSDPLFEQDTFIESNI